MATVQSRSDPLRALSGAVPRGDETILVLEPEPAEPPGAADTLRTLGYRVLRARDAQGALFILHSGVRVDLLVTDLEPPGPLPGSGLAERARQLAPGIAVLFTTADATTCAAAPAEVLGRPYRPEDLGRKVRHVLGNQQQVNALAAVLNDAPAAATRAAGSGPLAVLLVEDQDNVRDTSRQLLELLGCAVQAVPSAEAAEDVLRHTPFDVVLTDISLPGRSGIELARQAIQLQPGIQVVLSSGYGEANIDPAALAGVPTRNLPKPYGVPELEALLRELKGD